MAIKIIPFSNAKNGEWVGQFGRYKVTIYEGHGNIYWRGPSKEVVLKTDTIIYKYHVDGSHSGMAYSLPGAMDAAEKECISMSNAVPYGYRPVHAMDATQTKAEQSAMNVSNLEAIEADRIAALNGWDLAIDVLPELRAFAEQEGLFPFEVVKSAVPEI